MTTDEDRAGALAATARAEQAVRDIAAGRMVVVVDDADRENEGDVIMAADLVKPSDITFMATKGRGLICVSVEEERLVELDLPPMVRKNTALHGTAFTVSCDLARHARRGISAAERAETIKALADPATKPEHLSRPGHVFPLAARPGGVLARAGHTEAAHDLAMLAGHTPVGVLCEIMNDDGTMARMPELELFAHEHRLSIVSVADLVEYRLRFGPFIARTAGSSLPTDDGETEVHVYTSVLDGREIVAVITGEIGNGEDVPVRLHSECLSGDVLGSTRCDCGAQLRAAREAIAAEGRGILLYIRGDEGRGIGLTHKIRAYRLQDKDLDTVEANVRLGLPVDKRQHWPAALVLRDLGVRSVRLMTNNRAKVAAFVRNGIHVAERVQLETTATPHNVRYLRTKRDRMGHILEQIDEAQSSSPGE
jgi:3,4-dihydroxy 2-butanone 4-phosphate synthase/GTP cyclohydrolase II